MNRSELIAGIRANIAKSVSLLQQAEARVEELERTDDLDMFFVATEQVSIALEQVQVGIDTAVAGQKDAEVIEIIHIFGQQQSGNT
jgi:hypothetical protein